MKDKIEIFSPCCAFGPGVEEVHVLKDECPIKRELGQRKVRDREEVTCIYTSFFDGVVIPACRHYRGTKKVKRKGVVKYKVNCSALLEKEV
jgi:hypothetical protein